MHKNTEIGYKKRWKPIRCTKVKCKYNQKLVKGNVDENGCKVCDFCVDVCPKLPD